jgi:uncharacterized protein YgiM (DUF1202 family)
MVVFLSVFWFSVVLDIESRNSSAKVGNNPAGEATLAVSESIGTEDTSSEIMAFSYDSSNAADSRDRRLYGNLTEEASQTETYNLEVPEGTGEVSDAQEKTAARTASFAAVADTNITPAVTPVAEGSTDADGTVPAEGDTGESTGPIVTTQPEVQADPAAIAQVAEEEEKEVNEESKYSNLGISIANSYVNIRKDANTDSEVLGKLYNGSAAEILDTEGEWCHVESGSVKGYVKAEFLKTGIPDEELIKKYGVLRISVNVDGLNVREDADTESDKLTVVYQNERYPVVELRDDWVKVDITDDRVIGYVKREFVELIVDFKKAVSKEEEQELLRLQAEERAKQETAVKYRDEVDYTKDDLKLLACLVHAEAGNQSYEGRLAVANIVLNRVKSGKFPDTIKSVIYSPGQFSVASSGSLSKQLSNYENYSSNSQLLSIKAARAALEGANNIGSRLYFHSYRAAVKKGYDDKSNAVKIEDQLFW